VTGERRVIALLSALCVILLSIAAWAVATRGGGSSAATGTSVFWVAPDGDDTGPGTRDEPWATLQHAADSVRPGSTVYVRGGVYQQRLAVPTSGVPGRPIVFSAAPGERAVLDGSSLEVPADQNAMITIDSRSYIQIRGFEITGYRSGVTGHVPIGILVTGPSDHVRLDDNLVHDMGTSFQGRNGGDAHGIAVFGTDAAHAIEEVEIVDNELANLALGSSEALVVNGNVKDFLIEGNRVHDTNNIAIDVIGFEGTASDPTVDQPRDGVVRGNAVWNVDSYGNPAYGRDRSADGIYVDGGRDVLIEGARPGTSRLATTWCTTRRRSGSPSAGTTVGAAAPRIASS
jgi:Pel9A-like, right handed beta helix region